MLGNLKVYIKLSLLIGLALVIGLVVFNNRHNEVTVWFFKRYESINVLWLILFTAMTSIVSWWAVFASLGVWRDMRELRRVTELERAKHQRQKREKDLAERERRVDAKLADAIEREDKE